ncbi:MAG: hypothetical protein PHQ22_07785 [Sulfuricurvum sp.]|nr:hypothetical protein [Sulfuricurvum sp.]MDD5387075.1 hypothetical protein [Sulfuricurvum sp.]
MFSIISDTYSKFQAVHTLLNTTESTDSSYFAQLSEATQAAYIAMNEGMCINTTVCHQCAEHRDFLQTMIVVLEELEEGEPLTQIYRDKIISYNLMVDETLKKISAILASL